MSHTVTLEPDVARLVDEEARRSRRSFDEVGIDAIRRALAGEALADDGPYRVGVHRATLLPGVDPKSFNDFDDE